MTTLGIKDAFARYGATLRNVQWSVSAWAPDGSLVVSMWEHHRKKPPSPGALEFLGSASRWKGAGNSEFRENVAKAFSSQADVRLIIVRTNETAQIDAGDDASKVKKEFFFRDDVIGKVTEWDGDHYALRFVKA